MQLEKILEMLEAKANNDIENEFQELREKVSRSQKIIPTTTGIVAVLAVAIAILVLVNQQSYHSCPGSSPNQPASSCQQILNCDISFSSGYYWIASADGNATKVHCSMNRVCGGVSGGWIRVAELDMRNSDSQCPMQWTEGGSTPWSQAV